MQAKECVTAIPSVDMLKTVVRHGLTNAHKNTVGDCDRHAGP
jgi:hypothetical protein